VCRSSPVSFSSSLFARIPQRRQVQIIVFQQVNKLFPFLQRVIAFQWVISLQRIIAHKQLK
jgi:hypothetical protein